MNVILQNVTHLQNNNNNNNNKTHRIYYMMVERNYFLILILLYILNTLAYMLKQAWYVISLNNMKI